MPLLRSKICLLLCFLVTAFKQQATAQSTDNANSFIRINVVIDTVTDQPMGIAYRSGYRLVLDDFEADAEPGSDAVAMAYSGMDIRYNSMTRKGVTQVDVHITAVFDKSKSWCLAKSRTAWTLEHEQKHFDITALNTCLLREALLTYNYTRNYVQEIAALQQEYQQRTADMQDDYDAATNHGINHAAQEDWNARVPRMMQKISNCY